MTTKRNHQSRWHASNYGQPVYCTAGTHWTGQPHIVIEEGGSIPVALVCIPCLDHLRTDHDGIFAHEADNLVDLATMGKGHLCADYGEVRHDLYVDPLVVCTACGMILQDVPVQS